MARVTGYKRKRVSSRGAAIGRVAYRKVRRLERKVERKAFYLNANGVDLPGTTSSKFHVIPLDTISTGTSNSTRVGTKVQPTMLTANLCFRNNGAIPHCVRVLIIQGKGAVSSALNYFDDTTAVTESFLQPKGKQYEFDFKTHYDNIVTLSAGMTNNFPLMIKVSRMHQIQFDNSSSRTDGALWLLLIRDSGGTPGDVELDYWTKLAFTDS